MLLDDFTDMKVNGCKIIPKVMWFLKLIYLLMNLFLVQSMFIKYKVNYGFKLAKEMLIVCFYT